MYVRERERERERDREKERKKQREGERESERKKEMVGERGKHYCARSELVCQTKRYSTRLFVSKSSDCWESFLGKREINLDKSYEEEGCLKGNASVSVKSNFRKRDPSRQ